MGSKLNCRVCNEQTEELFSLGNLYIPNFINCHEDKKDYPRANLDMMFCNNCKTGQLKELVDKDILYKKYWYDSSISNMMRIALKEIVDDCLSSIKWQKNDVFLDIASNSGELLKNVPNDMWRIGIDPANKEIVEQSKEHCYLVNDYFTKESYYRATSRKAKIITCIAMFYQTPRPWEFLLDVFEILDDDGLFILQLSYTPLMLKELEFPNIVSEHVMYYNFIGLNKLLTLVGFKVVDVQLNAVNGGSFRIYCTKENSEHFRSLHERYIADIRVQSLLEYEEKQDFRSLYLKFWNDINNLREEIVNFVKSEILKGKKFGAIGASTKGSVLLEWFGLDSNWIKCISERNNIKVDKKMVGTSIYITNEEKFRKEDLDYAIILPWFFSKEIIEREKELKDKGVKFVLPCPRLQVI